MPRRLTSKRLCSLAARLSVATLLVLAGCGGPSREPAAQGAASDAAAGAAGDASALVVAPPLGSPLAAPPGRGTTPNWTRVNEGPDAGLWLSYADLGQVGSATAPQLRFAKLVDDGSTTRWSPTPPPPAPQLMLNWADFAKVFAFAGQGPAQFAAVWPSRKAPPPGTDADEAGYALRFAVSSPGAERWGAPAWLPDDIAGPEYGFVSGVADPEQDGVIAIAWLDGRALKPGSAQAHGAGSTGTGAMQLRGAKLHADGSVHARTVLDPRVCDCCATSTSLHGGQAATVYRDRSENEVRDIAFVGADGRGAEIVFDDKWTIAGCPVNGPQISGNPANDAVGAPPQHAALVWFSAAPEAQVKAGWLDEHAKVAEPMRVDLGAPLGRVDAVALADGSVVLSWMETDGSATARVLARRLDRGGSLGEARTIGRAAVARGSGFVRSASWGDEIFWAWSGGPGGEAGLVLVRGRASEL